ncbi:zinc transporter ZntB [Algirhabdus cladophorae]|uniref:zinc transporter ZntB n=1 Tax=Algirhabdus cladophorae TaxID=3377108 RepID=UPI003B846F80
MMIDQPDCFGFAYDAQGVPRALEDVQGAVAGVPEAGFVWVHARMGTDAGDAVLAAGGFDGLVLAALRAPETRPRCSSHADGSLMNLRGVNLNPGAEPEDMVSLRMWVRERVLVTVLMRPLQAVSDLRAAAGRGAVASGPAELVARLALRLADRAEPVVAALNERIDALEETDLSELGVAQRSELADLRRSAIVMRRYMVPQRDALSTFEIEDHGWMDSVTQSRIREATERVTRLGEELDAIRDRAQIVRDHLSDARAERMNDQMFVLSIVSALFLPLGFITGLLGINVGGVPGVENAWAFWIVCGLMLVIGAVQWLIFRRMGMFGR